MKSKYVTKLILSKNTFSVILNDSASKLNRINLILILYRALKWLISFEGASKLQGTIINLVTEFKHDKCLIIVESLLLFLRKILQENSRVGVSCYL